MIKSPFGFGIHHNDFIRVIKEKSKKLKFVGIFHSHPHENANSELSGWDINMIRNNPELIFLIGLNGSINEFRLFFYFYCKTKKIINSREII
jgi:proteasome lid subunit RPN8/RPN11